MRVWRGKKYVPWILKLVARISKSEPLIFSFLREGCWSGFSRFNIPPAEVDVSLCSAPPVECMVITTVHGRRLLRSEVALRVVAHKTVVHAFNLVAEF